MEYVVAVLMSTYNGEKYIRQQIESILTQRNCDVKLYVRDDGSNDCTVNILKEYMEKNKLIYYVGENLGPAKSFISLIKSAPDADFYAFADQDDVWMPQKLEMAISKIESAVEPSAYCSNMRRADVDMNIISDYALPKNVLTDFESVITMSGRIYGCTMVFNKKMVDFIRKREQPKYIIMHDLWIAMIASLYDSLYYDEKAYINYRTHSNSVTFYKRIPLSRKIKSIFCGGKYSVSEQCRCFVDYVGEEKIKSRGHWEICKLILDYKYNISCRIKLSRSILKKGDMSIKLRIHDAFQVLLKTY